MKIMIISDIHGGYEELKKVIDIYNAEGYERLFVLGDMYGGNSIDNNQIDNLLDSIKDKVMVRGNCDIFLTRLIDRYKTRIDGNRIVLVHNRNLAQGCNADIVFYGHTHIPSIMFENGTCYVNPGSIAKSREGENSFGTLDNDNICIKSIDNKVLKIGTIGNIKKA